LPPSTQAEYKRLVHRMQLLEKQKLAKRKAHHHQNHNDKQKTNLELLNRYEQCFHKTG